MKNFQRNFSTGEVEIARFYDLSTKPSTASAVITMLFTAVNAQIDGFDTDPR